MDVASNSSVQQYKCDVCNVTFQNKSNMNRHNKQKHGKTAVSQSHSYVCSFCGESYSTSLIYETHLLNVHGDKVNKESHQFNSIEEFMVFKDTNGVPACHPNSPDSDRQLVINEQSSNKSEIESHVQQVSNVETGCNFQNLGAEAINLIAEIQTDVLELVNSCTTSEERTKIINMLKGVKASVLGIKACTTSVLSSKLLPNSTMPLNKKINKQRFYSTKRKQANKILKKYKKPSSQEANRITCNFLLKPSSADM